MRGKDEHRRATGPDLGITPACAGKSLRCCPLVFLVRDHPRVCGEKLLAQLRTGSIEGSPPRMRGKVLRQRQNAGTKGITPAYAGKSRRVFHCICNLQDHPRVCGEK